MSKPAELRFRPSDSDYVTVIFGISEIKFYLEQSLVDAIPTIADEIRKRQAEHDPSLTFVLPEGYDYELDIFEAVIEWIYYRTLPDKFSRESGTDVHAFGDRIGPLYHLARYLKVWDLHNRLVDEEIEVTDTMPCGELLTLAYAGLRGTELYKLKLSNCVEGFMTGRIEDSVWHTWRSFFCTGPKVMFDILSSMREYVHYKKWDVVEQKHRCDFHYHPDGGRCHEATKFTYTWTRSHTCEDEDEVTSENGNEDETEDEAESEAEAEGGAETETESEIEAQVADGNDEPPLYQERY